MGREVSAENAEKIAKAEALIADGCQPLKAIDEVGLRKTTWRAYQNRLRDKIEDERSIIAIGKDPATFKTPVNRVQKWKPSSKDE